MTDTTATAPHVPITITSVDDLDLDAPDAPLACGLCGVRGDGPHDPDREHIVKGELFSSGDVYRLRTRVTRCDGCAALEARAAALCEEFPRARAIIGGVARERLTHALMALAAVGMTSAQRMKFRTNTEVLELVETLAPIGAQLLFQRRYTGTLSPTVKLGHEFAVAPWSHVEHLQRGVLRREYATLLAYRIDTPRLTPPPADGSPRGCLFCGVEGVVTRKRHAPGAWRPGIARAAQVGDARSDRATINGHFCPPCSAAIDYAGGVTITALEYALCKFVGANWANPQRPDLANLCAWVFTGRGATARPWRHIADHDRVRRLFEGKDA